MDRLEPDKGRQAKLLTEHLARQKVFAQQRKNCYSSWKRNQKREVEGHQAAEEKAKHIAAFEQHAANAHEVIQSDIVATFGCKAKEAALVAGATMEQAMEDEERAAAEAEVSMADASAMRE